MSAGFTLKYAATSTALAVGFLEKYFLTSIKFMASLAREKYALL